MSLHPGLFLCFRFSYGISRLRHFGNLEKDEEYSLKTAFSRFRKPVFLCFSARSRNPVQASRLFSLKDLESKDRVPGKRFDSLHTTKRRMFLDKKKGFSPIFLPLKREK